MDLTVSPLTAAHWPALEDLFGRAGASNGCWCMYWRVGPRYHTRNLFLGVASVFAQHGFQVVARRQPDRPVMRKALDTSA